MFGNNEWGVVVEDGYAANFVPGPSENRITKYWAS